MTSARAGDGHGRGRRPRRPSRRPRVRSPLPADAAFPRAPLRRRIGRRAVPGALPQAGLAVKSHEIVPDRKAGDRRTTSETGMGSMPVVGHGRPLSVAGPGVVPAPRQPRPSGDRCARATRAASPSGSRAAGTTDPTGARRPSPAEPFSHGRPSWGSALVHPGPPWRRSRLATTTFADGSRVDNVLRLHKLGRHMHDFETSDELPRVLVRLELEVNHFEDQSSRISGEVKVLCVAGEFEPILTRGQIKSL
jgi:hypothetical protein